MFNQALFLTILSVAAAGPAILPNVGQANPPVNPPANAPMIAPQGNAPVNQINQPQVNANQVNQGAINQINQINAAGFIQGPTAAQCNVQVALRQDCGFPGITNDQCVALGCCFSDLSPLSPYCFRPDLTIQTIAKPVIPDPIRDAVCTFNDLLRVSCGQGFTEEQCINRGCCFSATAQVNCAFAFVPIVGNGVQGVINAPQNVNNQVQVGQIGGQVPLAPQVAQVPPQQIQVGQANQIAGQVGEPLVPGGICDKEVAVADRIDCGFDGITEVACKAKNCCWKLLPAGVAGPVCFH